MAPASDTPSTTAATPMMMALKAATTVTPRKYWRSDCSVRPVTVLATARGTPMCASAQRRISGPSLSRKKRLSRVKDRKMASEASAVIPTPSPESSAWKALLTPELASALASCACSLLTPRSCTQPWMAVVASSSAPSMPDARLTTEPRIRTAIAAPPTTTARNTIAVPAPRPTPRRWSSPTAGESTAAMIDAVITGTTIVLVIDRIAIAPTSSAATPTSSQAIMPRSRSHAGAANMPTSCTDWTSTASPPPRAPPPPPPARA